MIIEKPAEVTLADHAPGSGAVAGAADDPSRLSSAHRFSCGNFLPALRGQEQIRVGLAENRQSISRIRGAYESALTHRSVSLAPLASRQEGGA